MKRKILLLMIAVVTSLTMTAQQTGSIKVGDYDNPTQVYNDSYFDMAPTNFYVAHTGVQMIYTPDLLADMNGKQDVKINSLSFKFYCDTEEEIVRDVKIYLQEIDATEFAVNDGVKQFFNFSNAVVESQVDIKFSDYKNEDVTLEFDIPDGFAFTPGKSLLVTIVFDAENDDNCTMGSDYAPFYSTGIRGKVMTYTNNWNSFVDYAKSTDFPNATASLGCGTNVELPVTEIGYSYTPVPANPTADGWYDCGDESGNSKFSFTLPTTDVDGNPIDPECLSYSIYTDDDQLFTFDKGHYFYNIDEDITEVPYSVYNSGYDFQDNHVFLYRTNKGDNPLFTERIGIQVHYTVDGVKNSSEIVYWTLPTEPAVPADPIADDWYDSGDESGYSRFGFTLPKTDVDGNPIDPECLSYSIYTDNDKLFTFDTEHYYEDIDEDITEVPYSMYNSGYDFYKDHVYFYRTNVGDNPLFNNRIGIQVHYTMDGVKNSSDIVYLYPIVFLRDNLDNSDVLAAYDKKTVTATLQGRTIYADGRWNTLCLPFNHTLNQDSPLAGFEVRGLDTEASDSYDHITGYDAETKTLWLNFKDATKIEAGKPYLVRKPVSDGSGTADPIVNPVFRNVTIDSSEPVGITSEDEGKTTTFLGVYTPVTFEKGTENRSVLFLQNNNLYYPNGEEATTIGAFRAYFSLDGIWGGEPEEPEGDSGVHSFVLNFGDGETSIQEIVNGKSSNGKSDEWYSVDGRKLEGKPTQKGIYIVNGKKMLIK